MCFSSRSFHGQPSISLTQFPWPICSSTDWVSTFAETLVLAVDTLGLFMVSQLLEIDIVSQDATGVSLHGEGATDCSGVLSRSALPACLRSYLLVAFDFFLRAGTKTNGSCGGSIIQEALADCRLDISQCDLKWRVFPRKRIAYVKLKHGCSLIRGASW